MLGFYVLLKLRDIAERLHCRLEGGAEDVDIVRVAGIEQAGPGDLTFLANPRYQPILRKTRASAIILAEGHGSDAPCPVLRSDNPYLAFAFAVRLLAAGAPPPPPGIDPSSLMAADVTLGTDVSIGPFVVVGAGASLGDRTVVHPHVVIGPGARIGDDCLLHAHVSIRERIVVGNRVVIHDGAVIGSDGFGFARDAAGSHVKIPQLADVVIEDDVEIGANTAIDRPAVGETRVRAGTKIDNLVQIAHGVNVGRRVLLGAQVGIAGSTVIEDEVMFGGQVGVAGHVRIGKGAVASGKTGITGSVDAGTYVSGYPSLPNLEWRKTQALVRRLPAMKKRIAELEHRIAELEQELQRVEASRPR
jgi:UDP-3-O-[3-hydroxymyristoyl] glucosamine N-acyltransferase